MASGPKDYRNPKTTTTDAGSKSNWLWYILGAIVLLLILAWLFGWLGGADDEITATEPVVTEEPVVAVPATDVDPVLETDAEVEPVIESDTGVVTESEPVVVD